jgi:hypothetical protein
MAGVVAESDRFDEILVELESTGDDARNGSRLERMGHSRSVMVAFRVDEHLRLAFEPPEGLRMHEAIAVPLEGRPDAAGLLGHLPGESGHHSLGLHRGRLLQRGRQVFQGGPISPGDRITIGEATITITPVRGPRQTPVQEVRVGETVTLAPPAAPLPSTGSNGPASAAPPATEVEYRTLRLSVYRLCRESHSAEQFATALVDFLDREFPPSEWAVGELSDTNGFRPLASTFLDGRRFRRAFSRTSRKQVVRSETVAGVLTLVVEPPRGAGFSLAILVRENPRPRPGGVAARGARSGRRTRCLATRPRRRRKAGRSR